MQGLSAGRVQSVATRLVVERERKRMAFVVADYWDIEGTFAPGPFAARLMSLDGKRVAQGRDFGPDGEIKGEAVQVDERRARALSPRRSRVRSSPSARSSRSRTPASRRRRS